MLPTTSKGQVIHINPAFKEKVLRKINGSGDGTIRTVTHINPLFIDISQPVTKIHMNPQFLTKQLKRKENVSTITNNTTLPSKETCKPESSPKITPLNKIISKSKTRIVRESQPRLVLNPARKLLLLTKRKLIRAETSSALTVQKSKVCSNKKQIYKLDNRIYSLPKITKFLKRRPNPFVAQYALRRANSNLKSNSLSIGIKRNSSKSMDSPMPSSNKCLRLININGIFYKSTGNKLQRKNENAIASISTSTLYNNAKSSKNSLPPKQSDSSKPRCNLVKNGHTFYIRGSKYIMDPNGFKLTRITQPSNSSHNFNGANYTSSKSFTNKNNAANITSNKNLNLPRRIDVGRLTYKASNQSQNVYVCTTTHLALAHLSQAKHRSVFLLSRSLRKTNKPCLIFQRLGKCAALERNRCSKVHDKQRIIVCPKFLQNSCFNSACLLSHNKTFQKMPVCRFFLQGSCVRNDCPYLHKKLSENTGICEDFRRGFCALAEKCNKQHTFAGITSRQSQIHDNSRDNKPKQTETTTNRYFDGGNFVIGAEIEEILNCDNETVEESEGNDGTSVESERSETPEDSDNENLILTSKKRKLGSLPAFIPFL